MCKSEFKRVLKLEAMFKKERSQDCVSIQVPSQSDLQKHKCFPLQAWWDLIFQIVPKPILVIDQASSEFVSMRLFEKYHRHIDKTYLELRVSGS